MRTNASGSHAREAHRASGPAGQKASPDAAPLLDAAALRAAGRTPAVPFRVPLGPEGELVLLRLLRVLPGKRIVGEGRLGGRAVLAKLFVGEDSGRHWRREREGIALLASAGVPTPQGVAAVPLEGGGHALLTEFLEGATTLLELWQPFVARPPGDPASLALLAPAFALLGRAHASGLSHDDLHLGNFLRHGEALHLIDGDAVRRHRRTPLPAPRAARDLAMLIAQLPLAWDTALAPLLEAYRRANALPDETRLARAIARERAWRLRDYLDKTGRDCSLFRVRQSARRFEAVLRAEAETLEPLLADPDAWITTGTLLKRGNTCTVARVVLAGRNLVVKRYNIKNARHALSRLWRPSRAWHSWREGHRLRLFGIGTPTPLALVEERWGPLRGRAWLVTEYCAGSDLLAHLAPDAEPPAAEARALDTLFATLHRQRISHGDLKATNLLWENGDLVVIDLDAMRQHRGAASHGRAWRRDRARLLRNWPEDSPLCAWLDRHLPPAP